MRMDIKMRHLRSTRRRSAHLILSACLLGATALAACAQNKEEPQESKVKEQGLVGTSCESKPVVRDSQGFNVCSFPEPNWPGLNRGSFWYSPLTAALAKPAAIKACKDANALDYGLKYGKSCYQACDEVTHCLVATPNPDV